MTRQFRIEQAADRQCSDDWREWPPQYRAPCEWAVQRELRVNGGAIVADASACIEQDEPIYRGSPNLKDYKFVLSRTITIESA